MLWRFLAPAILTALSRQDPNCAQFSCALVVVIPRTVHFAARRLDGVSPYHSLPRALVILDQPIDHAVDVLAINAWALDPVYYACPFVIACLDSREHIDAVHHIRLEINDWTLIEPGRREIARINVTARADLRHDVLRVFVGR